jgi:hypothetical protein
MDSSLLESEELLGPSNAMVVQHAWHGRAHGPALLTNNSFSAILNGDFKAPCLTHLGFSFILGLAPKLEVISFAP